MPPENGFLAESYAMKPAEDSDGSALQALAAMKAKRAEIGMIDLALAETLRLPSLTPSGTTGSKHQLAVYFHNMPAGVAVTQSQSGNAAPARVQNVGLNGTLSNHRGY